MRIGVATLLAAAALSACSHPQPLPVLGQVPDFTLTDQTGAPFSASSLDGHVWIADFIYTTCPGPCPLMTQRLRHIEQALAARPSVRFVSFSVDPTRDTAAILSNYARRFHAGPDWSFLTGDARTLDSLDWNTFHLGHLSAAFDHSTRFILVDGHRRIRAYYGMGQDNILARIVADASTLAKENS